MAKLKVLFVSTEIVPYQASGGLADVAEALPFALQDQQMEVVRVMPKHQGIEKRYSLEKVYSYIVEVRKAARVATLYRHNLNGLTTYFIGSQEYFERERLYGYEDDDERYGFFCKATLEMLLSNNIQPQVIHLNDWQTALTALYLKEEYSKLAFYQDIKVVFTIHNLQYQGVFDRGILEVLSISNHYFNSEAIEYYGKVCYMKAGILYSDQITTVSRSYAKEIQTPDYGYGLDGLLRKSADKITGILNGIYYDKYNPAKDDALRYPFDSDNFRTVRPKQKRAFQEAMGLPVKDVPLIGVVTRLAEQKGINLIIDAIYELVKQDVQFVILGSGEERYEHELRRLNKSFANKISGYFQFNQELARQIYGSADYFLMPSLFEPCGLSQLYSLRYGAIPIVRETGGLRDTIIDYTRQPDKGTGFTFHNYTKHAFVETIERALALYQKPTERERVIERAMTSRFPWDESAARYITLYRQLAKVSNDLEPRADLAEGQK